MFGISELLPLTAKTITSDAVGHIILAASQYIIFAKGKYIMLPRQHIIKGIYAFSRPQAVVKFKE